MLQSIGRQRYSFGLFLVFIGLMAFGCGFAGCREKNMADPGGPDTAGNTLQPGSRYLALGDSYTIGQGVPELARFPVQVAEMLTAQGISVSKPDIIAATGWTTQNLLDAIAAANPAKTYDIVTLLIGVNDQYQRRDTTGYRLKFTENLVKAIELAAGKKHHVFVLSIPDYSVTPFGQSGNAAETANQIDQFNAINKAVTQAYGIDYTDVTTISRSVKNNPEMLAGDGLHPSGSQYRLWAERLVPAIRAVLR